MEQEEWVKGQQGANRTASVAMLPGMSPIPSLAFISFISSYLYLSILHRITPTSRTLAQDPLEGASLRFLRMAHGL